VSLLFYGKRKLTGDSRNTEPLHEFRTYNYEGTEYVSITWNSNGDPVL
jgi:hypothetical protein